MACLQHQAGRVVLGAVLVDLCVLTSWQLLDPLRWVVLQHGSQVATTVSSTPMTDLNSQMRLKSEYKNG